MYNYIFLLICILIFTLSTAVIAGVYLDAVLKVVEKILKELKYMKD